MTGFTKLFNSILYSTIWTEPDHIRITWITMLAMADKYGDVKASLPGLARMAGMSIEKVQASLECFKSPDPHSSTKDFEGRRIVDIDGGWNLINHGKYRAMMSAEERKEYNRLKQAERRDRIKNEVKSKNVNDSQLPVKDNQQNKHIASASASVSSFESDSLKGESEGNLGKGTKEELIAYCSEQHLPESDGLWLFEKWTESGWRNGNRKIRDWKGTIRSWKLAGYMASQKQPKGFSTQSTVPPSQRDYSQPL